MKIFDTHVHYDDSRFDKDRDIVINSLKDENIINCINIGCDIETSIKACEIAEKYGFIYAAVGIHPTEIKSTVNDIDMQIKKIKEIVQGNKKVVAIGEIGLDYHWNKDNKELQQKAFIKQIELANELDLPISIHTRDAIDDTINIIKQKIKIEQSGVLHCCPFNIELVKHGLKAGLYIAFGGTCTFKNAKNADEIIKIVPEERILVETDSPYLAPEPLRGTRNDSKNLKYIIKKISSVKGKTPEYIANTTYFNARKVFKI